MAPYLLPNEEIECIDDQRKFFAIRNKQIFQEIKTLKHVPVKQLKQWNISVTVKIGTKKQE